MGHSNHDSKPLGIIDVLGGALVFLLLCCLIYFLLSAGVPGLLKIPTLIQIVVSGLLFLLVWGLFGNSLFQAYFSVLLEREEKTLGAERKAQELKSQTIGVQHEVDEEIKKSRLIGVKKRDQLVEQAKTRAAQITDEARQSVEEKLKFADEELEQKRDEALSELESEAKELSKLVKERALASDLDSRTIH